MPFSSNSVATVCYASSDSVVVYPNQDEVVDVKAELSPATINPELAL